MPLNKSNIAIIFFRSNDFGQDFSAASMIGVIALAGVVVRNSLLIVDFIREREAQGVSVEQAASDAGALRLIPIMLTTLAIAFGTLIMVPLILSLVDWLLA